MLRFPKPCQTKKFKKSPNKFCFKVPVFPAPQQRRPDLDLWVCRASRGFPQGHQQGLLPRRHTPERLQPSYEPIRTSLDAHVTHPIPPHKPQYWNFLIWLHCWLLNSESNNYLSPSELVSILRNPAQLINTVGAIWQTVTSWLRFSTLWLACLRVLRMAMAFLGPRPHTNCSKLDTLDSCSVRFRSTPTSLVLLTNSRLRPSSSSSLSSWSWKIWIYKLFFNKN